MNVELAPPCSVAFRGPAIHYADAARGDLFFTGYLTNIADLASSLGLMVRDGLPQILTAACRKWGSDIARHAIGEFALVYTDRQSGRTLLAHDEFGLRTLFYQTGSGQLTVAFHIAHLARQAAALDDDYLSEILVTGEQLSHRTPYVDVSRLLPGQSAEWSGHCLQLHDCWSLGDLEPIRYDRADDYAEHFNALLGEAVLSAIPPGGKTWCELSGGLDSSTVLAMALRGGAAEIEAVSYVYPESSEADEQSFVRTMLEAYPVPLHTIDGDANRPFTASPDPMWAVPGGGMLHAARDRAYAALLRAHSVDVVLTGMAGDQVLFGNPVAPFFLADLLRQGRFGALLSELVRWSNTAYPRRSYLFWLHQGALHPLLPKKVAASASQAAPWATARAIERARACMRNHRTLGPQTRSIAARYYLAGVLNGANIVSTWLLPREMPADMRHPLLYRPLVAFLCSVPWDVQAGGRATRRLQRQALQGVLPPAILNRQGKPLFDQALFRGLAETTSWFRTSGRDSVLAEKGLWNGEVWDEAVSKARLGYVPVLQHFLAAASLEHWLAC